MWGVGQQQIPLLALLPIAGPGRDLLNTGDLLAGPASPRRRCRSRIGAALSGFAINVQVAELQFDPSFLWVGLPTSNGLQPTVGAL